MSKTITIKLTQVAPSSGPFTILDQFRNVIAEGVSKKTLMRGINYTVSDDVILITLKSTGDCTAEKTIHIRDITESEYINLEVKQVVTGCTWRHLTNIQLYNSYYGVTRPYIIEYPKDSSPNTEILQSISDYSKVYKYFSNNNYNSNDRIELDDKYFNKLIVYNNQQSSGMLELVAKPINNLHAYNKYPIYNLESKTILYTKTDNFYKVNSFWDIVKSKTETLFISSCISSSIDKEINKDNMVYTNQAFKKYPLRAKDVKIRYILDNDDSIHIVSQFVLTFNQISYK
jgi:hypothetical protein